MKRILIFLAVLIILAVPVAVIAANDDNAGSNTVQGNGNGSGLEGGHPKLATEIILTGGFRFLHHDGSRRVEEYENIKSWPYFNFELRAVPYPHRLHLDIELKNEKDYYGDLTYAYKDLVLFRLLNSTLYHNLDNFLIPYVSGSDPDQRDSGDEYGMMVGITNVLLRLKTPDYPAHLYFEGSFVHKSGTAQQMFLGGSGYFTPDRIRTSESRIIDWDTTTYTVGANSHIGPVEVDYSHSEKRFNTGTDSVLKYDYVACSGGCTYGWEGGLYQHNLVPDLKGSTDTIKLHTMLTGGIVGAATVSWTDRENRYSGAEADYFFGSGDLTWMPVPHLTVFLKYRHYERDLDNPDSVTMKKLYSPYKQEITDIRDSISSVSDVMKAAVRWRPIKGLVLKGEYSYESVRRSNAEAWELPDSTERARLTLSADLRIAKGLNLKAKYSHREINDPATNAEPDSGDEGSVSLSWTPLPWLTAMLNYNIRDEDRAKYHFLYSDNEFEGDDRNLRSERFTSVISIIPLKNLSLTGSFAYFKDRIEQDIMFGSPPAATPNMDSGVPYEVKARNFNFGIGYSPISEISLNGGVNYTISEGNFYPSANALTDPVSVEKYSQIDVRETIYSASGEYRFKGGISVGFEYRYTDLNDKIDNPYDDIEDSDAHVVFVTLTKKW